MFTGLVQELGRVAAVDRGDDGVRLRIQAGELLTSEIAPGDSVAVNGVCLTATEIEAGSFAADVMHQTLRTTALGRLREEDPVNLELSLRASDRLGGHVVQGHVDGIGEVVDMREDGFARLVEIEPTENVHRYLIEKGSIAVEGVSLTVAAVGDRTFTVSLIPETLARTTLGELRTGAQVNLEVDVLAKYVERLTGTMRPWPSP